MYFQDREKSKIFLCIVSVCSPNTANLLQTQIYFFLPYFMQFVFYEAEWRQASQL